MANETLSKIVERAVIAAGALAVPSYASKQYERHLVIATLQHLRDLLSERPDQYYAVMRIDNEMERIRHDR